MQGWRGGGDTVAETGDGGGGREKGGRVGGEEVVVWRHWRGRVGPVEQLWGVEREVSRGWVAPALEERRKRVGGPRVEKTST